MNERLGIETAIALMGNVNKEEIERLKTAYNNYSIGKRFEREFLNDARNELLNINKVFENAGLDAPFILSYEQLNQSIEQKRAYIKDLEEKRSEARRAYMSIDAVELSRMNPSLTIAEIEKRKDAARVEWDKYNTLIDNAWKDQRALLDQKEAIKDPAAFDRECFSIEYLTSIANGKAQTLLDSYIPIETTGLDGQPIMSAERLNILLQSRLYGVELSLEAAKQRRQLIDKNIATFEEVGKALGMELIYDEKEISQNSSLGAPTRTFTSPQPQPTGSNTSPKDDEEKLNTAIATASSKITDATKLIQTQKDTMSQTDKDSLNKLINELVSEMTNGNAAGIDAKTTLLSDATSRITATLSSGAPSEEEEKTKAIEKASAEITETMNLMQATTDLKDADKDALNNLIKEVQAKVVNGTPDEINAKVAELKAATNRIFKDEKLKKAIEEANKQLGETAKLMFTQAGMMSQEDQEALTKLINEVRTANTNGNIDEIQAKTAELKAAVDRIFVDKLVNKAIEEANKKIAEVEDLMQSKADSISQDEKDSLEKLIAELKSEVSNKSLNGIKAKTTELDETADKIFVEEMVKKAVEEANKKIAEVEDLMQRTADTLSEEDKETLDNLINELKALILNGTLEELKEKTAQLDEASNRIFKNEKLRQAIEAAEEEIKEADELIQAKADNISQEDKEVLDNLINELQAAINLKDIDLIQAKTAELNEATNRIFKDEKLDKAIADASEMIDIVVDAMQSYEDDLPEADKKTLDDLIQEVKDAITSKDINEIKAKTAKLDDISDIIFDSFKALDEADALFFGSKDDLENDEKDLLTQKVAELKAAKETQDNDKIKKATEELNNSIANIQKSIKQRKQAELDHQVPPKKRFKVTKERVAKIAKFAGRVLMAGAIAGLAMTGGIGFATGIWLSPGILAPLPAVLASTGFSAGLQVLYEKIIRPKHGKVPEIEKMSKKNKTPLWISATAKWTWKKTFGSLKERLEARKAAKEAERLAQQQEQEQLEKENAAKLAASLEAQRNATPGVSPKPLQVEEHATDLGDPFAEDEDEDLTTAPASSAGGEPIVVEETGAPAEDETLAQIMQNLYNTDILKDGPEGPIGGPLDIASFAQALQGADPDLLARYQALQNNDLGEEPSFGGRK